MAHMAHCRDNRGEGGGAHARDFWGMCQHTRVRVLH